MPRKKRIPEKELVTMFRKLLHGATYGELQEYYGYTDRLIRQSLRRVTEPSAKRVLYKVVRDWMTENEISVADLASKCYVSYSSMNHYVRNEGAKFPKHVRERIADMIEKPEREVFREYYSIRETERTEAEWKGMEFQTPESAARYAAQEFFAFEIRATKDEKFRITHGEPW